MVESFGVRFEFKAKIFRHLHPFTFRGVLSLRKSCTENPLVEKVFVVFCALFVTSPFSSLSFRIGYAFLLESVPLGAHYPVAIDVAVAAAGKHTATFFVSMYAFLEKVSLWGRHFE